MTETDIVIIGGGPIGIELAAGLQSAGLDALVLEAGQIAQTIRNWPPRTRFLSEPEWISLAGEPAVNDTQERLLGEEYVAYIQRIVRDRKLDVRCDRRVTTLARSGKRFEMTAVSENGRRESYIARRVVLATGDMARPRWLGIDGEDLPHVHHTFGEPSELRGLHVLIVGGRNSAVEAAIRLTRIGAKVTISYRREKLLLDRISPKLVPVICEMLDEGRVEMLSPTVAQRIQPAETILADLDESGEVRAGSERTVPAERVIVLVGFEADVSLMEQAGVRFPTPTSRPTYDPDTMETNVPGLYVAGTAAAGRTYGHEEFIQTSHVHVDRIVRSLIDEAPSGRPGQ